MSDEIGGEEILQGVNAVLSGEEPAPREKWEWRGATAPDGRPMIELPRDERSLSSFAEEVGRVLACNGVFVRDGAPVVVDPITKRLEELDADCFRTYAEKSLFTARFKKPRGEDEGKLVISTMTREQARGVLRSHDFRKHQRAISGVLQVPVPVMRPDGTVDLLETGWDEQTGLLVIGEGKMISSPQRGLPAKTTPENQNQHCSGQVFAA